MSENDASNQPSALPPPIPLQRHKMSRAVKIIIVFGMVNGLLIAGLFALRVFGLLRPFSVSTGAMAPTVSAGDHVLMEGLSFLGRKPRRGDIVVFETTGIQGPPPGQFYLKRVAGEPGEHVQISADILYVNGRQTVLSNKLGEIVYRQRSGFISGSNVDLVVPRGEYFVLGDNSTNSYDSRYFGCVPARKIVGRICFCLWPADRIGTVR